MSLSNSQVKGTTRQGDRLIRVMAASNKRRGYRTMTFSENEVQAIASLDDDQTALVLRSGLEVPVALGYDALEQKIYRPDFKTDNDDDVLDLRALTGEAARPSFARLDPGHEMPDGTLFAGVSPDTGEGLFVAPREKSMMMDFNQAAEYTAGRENSGYKDWRLPTQRELAVLFNNRAAIGDFDQSAETSSWYWGSTMKGNEAVQRYFNDGKESFYGKTDKARVRCVRDWNPGNK